MIIKTRSSEGKRLKVWISDSGTFLFGKHRGRLVSNVARTDPDYLSWIIDEVDDCTDEDREIFSAQLRLRR